MSPSPKDPLARTGAGGRLTHRSKRRVAPTVLVVAVLASCGGGSPGNKPTAPPGAPTAATAPRPAFDPPTRFDVGSGVRLPDDALGENFNHGGRFQSRVPIRLVGATAFVATPTSLLVIDATTGRVNSTIEADRQPAADSDRFRNGQKNRAEPPLTAEIDGAPVVLFPVPVTIPGQGTSAARDAVEIITVATGSGKKLGAVDVELLPPVSSLQRPLNPAVVGVVGAIAVLRADRSTYAVDLAAKKTLWSKSGFDAVAVADGVVVGGTDDGHAHERVAGLSVTDGTQRWIDGQDSTGLTVEPAGKFVAVSGSDYGTGRSFLRLTEAATGKSSAIEAAGGGVLGATTDITCSYDEQSITICASAGWVGGIDASTGKLLWALPDKQTNRTAIELTGSWHGAVYGTTGNGPVVLDARTGADRQPTPGAAPYVANNLVGVASHPTGRGLYAFPTSG